MSRSFTRRQVLAQIGIAAAAVHTLDPHELCCGPMSAYAQTNEKNLFELMKVGDGARPRIPTSRSSRRSRRSKI